MWIDFECTGGFANLRLKFKVHTDELPQELAAEIKELVEVSGYFNIQPSDVTPAVNGPPDVFHYTVTVADGSQKRALFCNDVSAPAALHPLLEKFRTLAMDRRRQGK
ncbi:MAG: hypothetical protein P8010_07405 [Desulfosarcinaceae bacterium]|jgi:hypothetical protein